MYQLTIIGGGVRESFDDTTLISGAVMVTELEMGTKLAGPPVSGPLQEKKLGNQISHIKKILK